MKNTAAFSDLRLKKIKSLLKAKSGTINIQKITAKRGCLIVEENENIIVKISIKKRSLVITPQLPTIGSPAHMVCSLFLLIALFFLGFRKFAILGIIGGQSLAFIVCYPNAIQLKNRIIGIM